VTAPPGEPNGAAGSDGDADICEASGRRRAFFFGVRALGDANGSWPAGGGGDDTIPARTHRDGDPASCAAWIIRGE